MNLRFGMLLLGVLGLLVACGRPGPAVDRDARGVLLFAGEGTSPGDVAAWKQILVANRLGYAVASTSEFNRMTAEDFRAYQLILVPGGNYERIGKGLEARAAVALRDAVRGGTNYLGVCAGAFFAGASPYNGLDLFDGRRFEFHALSREGVRKAVVVVTSPGGSEVEHYWEDGPQLSGWGAIIAKYPDGTPAAVQGSVGHGWVVLVGTHPEAPENWRGGMTFHAPARVSQDFASRVLVGAYEGRALPQFQAAGS